MRKEKVLKRDRRRRRKKNNDKTISLFPKLKVDITLELKKQQFLCVMCFIVRIVDVMVICFISFIRFSLTFAIFSFSHLKGNAGKSFPY